MARLDIEACGLGQFPAHLHSTVVSDELNAILAMLQEACPPKSRISFDFDGRLHVHIDLHKREEVDELEALLPTMGAGLFHAIQRGATPNHPFMHRISALVNR